MKTTNEYIERNKKFSLKFGYDMPLAMISPSEKWKISKDVLY